jgi:hypothetical protein
MSAFDPKRTLGARSFVRHKLPGLLDHPMMVRNPFFRFMFGLEVTEIVRRGAWPADFNTPAIRFLDCAERHHPHRN